MPTAAQNVDLRPQVVNIAVTEGDTWAMPVTMTGYDLTGATIEGQIRATPESETPIELVITAVDLVEGQFTYGQVAASEAGYYDIQVTPTVGPPRTYIRGYLSVDPDITHG